MMREHKYVLDEDGKPIPMPDLFVWGEWYGHPSNRIVKQTKISDAVRVSTVFLALDHSYSDTAAPVLWETMIFGGKHDQTGWRYSRREDALLGHEMAVKMAESEGS